MSDNSIGHEKSTLKMTKKRLVVLGVALIVLGVVSILAVMIIRSLNETKTPALIVGEVEVSQADFDKYVHLCRQDGLTKSQVRELVVEYEKNRQMADKYNIKIPKMFIEYVRTNNEAVRSITELQGAEADRATGGLSNILDYNNTFDLRVSQSTRDGYGVFVYEIASNASTGGGTSDSGVAKFEQAKKIATEFRDKISRNHESAATVLEEVRQYNANYGQAVNSNFTFVHDSEFGRDDGAGAHVKSHPYLLSVLERSSENPTAITRTDRNSAFFIYKLYKQSAQDDIAAKIEESKEQIRVVIYDK